MTRDDIFELVACFDRSTAQVMKVTMGDFALELSRGGAAVESSAALAVSAAPAVKPAVPAASGNGEAIKAPLVGTFYAAMAPDQPPLVAVGDRVTKGQTVCLLEAMKMMSEVTAPCDCVITEICKANGELATFGEPLMRYQPC